MTKIADDLEEIIDNLKTHYDYGHVDTKDLALAIEDYIITHIVLRSVDTT